MANDQNQTHRVVGDNHYHDGELLRTGATFTPSEQELEAYGHKFEPVDDGSDTTDTTDSTDVPDVDPEIDDTVVDAETDTEIDSMDADTDSQDDVETYSREDLEEKDYSELQQLAVESNDDSINGGSSKDAIVDALAADGDEE